jgi:hypothetical protein
VSLLVQPLLFKLLLLCSNIYQHLVSLLVQPPLRSELAGVDLPGGGRLPDLDAAIAILEQVKRVITLIFLLRLLQCCGYGIHMDPH